MPVPCQVAAALLKALDDEYKAIATYQAVIDAFGPLRPFINIIEAEHRHAAALHRVMTRRGVPIPDNSWLGAITAPPDLAAACQAGIDAEIDNAALYDDLLTAVAGDAELTTLFARLRDASQHRHLPAFRRSLDGGQGHSGCGRRGH